MNKLKNWLFATPENNYSPGIFKITSLLLVLALFILLELGIAIVFPKHQIYASDLTLQNIISAVNHERDGRNLVLLNYNDKLATAAQSKSDDMIARHYFAHVDPDGNYIWPKIVAAGYTPYSQLGENLAIEFYTTDSLVSAWMNSPTHRANILNESFRDQGMGLGFGNSQNGEYYSSITNTFGTLITKKPIAAYTAPQKNTHTTATKKAVKPPTVAKNNPLILPSSAPLQATPTTTPTLTPKPVYGIRGESTEQSFALSNSKQNTTSPSSSTAVGFSDNQPGVAGTTPSNGVTSLQINRYITLALGILLLLILLGDLKVMVAQKFQNLDKKLNSIVILILSLLVVGFMYWM